MTRRTRSSRINKSTVRLAACIAVVCVILITSLVTLSTLRSGRVSIDTIGATRSVTDRVDALLLIRDIDTARQEAKLRLYLDPAGALADATGRFARTVVVDSSNENTSGLLTAESGSTTLITDFVTTFDRGDDVSFPFDKYTSTIWLSATLENGDSVPIRVKFEAADSTYRYDAVDLSGTDADTAPTFDLVVARSGLAKTIALVVVVLMWALALAVGAVTWLVITRTQWRQRAFEVLGWLAAMLFALIQLRGVAPGAPGFGTLFDFLGFFWAELITAAALCLIVVILIRSEMTIGTSTTTTEPRTHTVDTEAVDTEAVDSHNVDAQT